jgi:hypothetical protein
MALDKDSFSGKKNSHYAINLQTSWILFQMDMFLLLLLFCDF